MNTIETERLILRNFRQDDWRILHQIINAYMSSDLAQYDHQWPTTEKEIQKITQWFAGEDSYMAVCLKPYGQLIGFAALNPEKQEGEKVFNLGYIFHFDYHGKGYATEACKAALSHAFGALQADRIISGSAAANDASCRLLSRLGFKLTSQNLTSYKKGEDGKPIEFMGCSFELSRKDWQAGDIFPVH